MRPSPVHDQGAQPAHSKKSEEITRLDQVRINLHLLYLSLLHLQIHSFIQEGKGSIGQILGRLHLKDILTIGNGFHIDQHLERVPHGLNCFDHGLAKDEGIDPCELHGVLLL